MVGHFHVKDDEMPVRPDSSRSIFKNGRVLRSGYGCAPIVETDLRSQGYRPVGGLHVPGNPEYTIYGNDNPDEAESRGHRLPSQRPYGYAHKQYEKRDKRHKEQKSAHDCAP
jgi:hypothetical protein